MAITISGLDPRVFTLSNDEISGYPVYVCRITKDHRIGSVKVVLKNGEMRWSEVLWMNGAGKLPDAYLTMCAHGMDLLTMPAWLWEGDGPSSVLQERLCLMLEHIAAARTGNYRPNLESIVKTQWF